MLFEILKMWEVSVCSGVETGALLLGVSQLISQFPQDFPALQEMCLPVCEFCLKHMEREDTVSVVELIDILANVVERLTAPPLELFLLLKSMNEFIRKDGDNVLNFPQLSVVLFNMIRRSNFFEVEGNAELVVSTCDFVLETCAEDMLVERALWVLCTLVQVGGSNYGVLVNKALCLLEGETENVITVWSIVLITSALSVLESLASDLSEKVLEKWFHASNVICKMADFFVSMSVLGLLMVARTLDRVDALMWAAWPMENRIEMEEEGEEILELDPCYNLPLDEINVVLEFGKFAEHHLHLWERLPEDLRKRMVAIITDEERSARIVACK
jgi:hypothetical protein